MEISEFKSLLLLHYKMMYKVALTILKDVNNAQDVTQEAVASLWERRENLSTIENIQAFLVTVIKRQCIDYIRANKKCSVPIDDAIGTVSNDEFELRYDCKESLQQVMSLMKTLPDNQQQVLRLRSFCCCSMEEISQITGFTVVNVRALISRARRRLRELYLISEKQ